MKLFASTKSSKEVLIFLIVWDGVESISNVESNLLLISPHQVKIVGE